MGSTAASHGPVAVLVFDRSHSVNSGGPAASMAVRIQRAGQFLGTEGLKMGGYPGLHVAAIALAMMLPATTGVSAASAAGSVAEQGTGDRLTEDQQPIPIKRLADELHVEDRKRTRRNFSL